MPADNTFPCLIAGIFYFQPCMPKNWFLCRVYKLDKRLFFFFVFFLTGTLVTNLLGWQVTPFFVWGMYSEREKEPSSQPVFKITINDSAVVNYSSGYADANRFFLTSPLQLYLSIKQNDGEDPTAVFLKRKLGTRFSWVENTGPKVLNDSTAYHAFLPWYKKYLEQTTGLTIHKYTIELMAAGYDANNKINILSSGLIDTWKQ